METRRKTLVYYMRSMLYTIAILFSLLVIMGLDQCVFEGCDCDDAIQSLLEEKGTPIDFEIVESGTTNKHTYRYVDDLGVNREYSFEWGEEDSEGNTLKVCCKESTVSVEEEEPEEPVDPEEPTDPDEETDPENGTDPV